MILNFIFCFLISRYIYKALLHFYIFPDLVIYYECFIYLSILYQLFQYMKVVLLSEDDVALYIMLVESQFPSEGNTKYCLLLHVFIAAMILFSYYFCITRFGDILHVTCVPMAYSNVVLVKQFIK